MSKLYHDILPQNYLLVNWAYKPKSESPGFGSQGLNFGKDQSHMQLSCGLWHSTQQKHFLLPSKYTLALPKTFGIAGESMYIILDSLAAQQHKCIGNKHSVQII